jgi:hypothetical protein
VSKQKLPRLLRVSLAGALGASSKSWKMSGITQTPILFSSPNHRWRADVGSEKLPDHRMVRGHIVMWSWEYMYLQPTLFPLCHLL